MIDMTGDDFITKLVEETMSHTKEHDENVQCDVIELEKYFNSKNQPSEASVHSNRDQSSQEIQLEFIAKSELGVYRLECNNEIWDFPMNWSIFEMMDDGCSISIKSNHRHSHLLVAFTEILKSEVQVLDFSYVEGKLTCSARSVQNSQSAAA